jgi:capsular polysaccharide biosynthesis protein
MCGYEIKELHLIEGKSISLWHRYDQNYYHWLIELIPNLSVCSYIDDSVKVIVSSELPKQFYQALELVLPSNCEVLYINTNLPIEQEEALVTIGMHYSPKERHTLSPPKISDSYQSLFPIKWLTSKVHSEVLNGYKPRVPIKKYIYLARKGNSGQRCNITETEMISKIQLLGIDIIYPEDLSFEQQVKLFNKAEIIIGSAGAAFANLVFCSKNCRVIMLTLGDGNDTHYSFFHKIANLVGLNFSYFTTQQTKADNGISPKTFCTHAFDSNLLMNYIQSEMLNDNK